MAWTWLVRNAPALPACPPSIHPDACTKLSTGRRPSQWESIVKSMTEPGAIPIQASHFGRCSNLGCPFAQGDPQRRSSPRCDATSLSRLHFSGKTLHLSAALMSTRVRGQYGRDSQSVQPRYGSTNQGILGSSSWEPIFNAEPPQRKPEARDTAGVRGKSSQKPP